MAIPESASQRPRRRKEARPGELIAAALELFVAKGFAATRLDEVAAHAGVSKGTVYLYFSSKEELFKAVVREGIVPVLATAESMVASYRGDAAGLLREVLLGWWRQIGATPLAGLPKLIVSEARNFPELAQYYADNVIVRGRRLLASVLERGIASGEFRAMDVETTVDVVIAPLLMLVILRYSLAPCCPGGQGNPEAYLAIHLDLLLHGLRRA